MCYSKRSVRWGQLLTAVFVFCATSAFGGHVFTFEQSGSGADGDKVVLSVEGQKIKVTTSGKAKSEMVFDQKAEAMQMIEHGRKKYVTLDREMIDDLVAQMESAMAQLEEQLANVPPAQRKMMENMMKGRLKGLGEELPELSLERTGETDTIAGYKAEKVLVSANGEPVRELWVADWDKVKGSEDIASALQSMSEMLGNMFKAFSKGPMAGLASRMTQSNWLNQVHELEGIPVMTREFGPGGSVKSEMRLAEVVEKELGADFFDIPKGYKKQKMGR